MAQLESSGRALEEWQVCRGESEMSHCPWPHMLRVRPLDLAENNCNGSSEQARVQTPAKPHVPCLLGS